MIRRMLAAVLLLICASDQLARAEDFGPRRLGLGFRGTRAPVGVRWWYARDAAIDAGIGFQSTVDGGVRLNRYVAQFGFPFVLHRWSRVGAQIRPGFEYALEDQLDVYYPALGTYTKAQDHVYQAAVELEAEAFLADHISVSASFGVAMARRNFGQSGFADETAWSTLGGNFSQVGFHLYFGPAASR